MIDRIVEVDEQLTRTAFRPAPGTLFVEHGFFREPGLVENIAQTAAAGAGWLAQRAGKPIRVAYIGAVRNLEIFDLPGIGEEIITEVEARDMVMGVMVVLGRIRQGERLIAECEMRIFPA